MPEEPVEFILNKLDGLLKPKPKVIFVMGGPGAGKGT